jgi:hypothetical protein
LSAAARLFAAGAADVSAAIIDIAPCHKAMRYTRYAIFTLIFASWRCCHAPMMLASALLLILLILATYAADAIIADIDTLLMMR